MTNLIVIDGNVVEVKEINNYGYGTDIETDSGSYKLFESRDDAEEAAEQYYRDMAENDKEEFITLVGAENLVEWCLGNWAGPGSEKCRSLEEWFDTISNYPEEVFGSYNGTEYENIKCNRNFLNEIDVEFEDMSNIVLYRTN